MNLSASIIDLDMSSIIVVAVYRKIALALWSSTYVLEMPKRAPFVIYV